MLLLHVLMLSLLSSGSTRVVEDFESECGQFFANRTSPTRFPELRYKQICQTLDNAVYYATFYHTDNKIPVYSAYKFEGQKGCKRQKCWYIEPQIDDDDNTEPNMASQGTVDRHKRGKRQALNGDYENSGYDKGHLAPVYQANSQSCAYATFTLTNAAPQERSFNRDKWRILERDIGKELSEQCLPKKYVYIVTGVVPGTNSINNKVNVPSHFWTAYCCLDQNNRCSISKGVIGTNDNNSNIRKMSVAALEEELRNLYGRTFQLFR